MQKIKQNFLRTGLIFSLFFLLLYFILPSSNENRCFCQERFDNLEFNGKVVKKYFDKNQHSVPILEILNEKGELQHVNFFLEQTTFYQQINTNDSVNKRRNSNVLYIFNNNTIKKAGQVDFGCRFK
jgi:primosomal protein N''